MLKRTADQLRTREKVQKKKVERERESFGLFVEINLSRAGHSALPFPLSTSVSWTMNEQQQVIVVLVQMVVHCLFCWLVVWNCSCPGIKGCISRVKESSQIRVTKINDGFE